MQNSKKIFKYSGYRISNDAAILKLAEIFLQFGFSKRTLNRILLLINFFIPYQTRFPKNLYNFNLILNKNINITLPSNHYICLSCNAYYDTANFDCQICNSKAVIFERYMVFSIKSQLIEILQISEVCESLILTFNQRVKNYAERNNQFSYPYWYKYMEYNPTGSFITLILNFDGVSLTESNTKSLWPTQLAIMEIPLLLRTRYIMLASLWYARIKPPITIFEPLVAEFINLNKNLIILEKLGKVHV